MIHPLDFLAYSSDFFLSFIVSFIFVKSSGTFMPLLTAGLCSIVSNQVLISGNADGSTPAHSPQLTHEKTQMSLRVYLLPTRYAASPSGTLWVLRCAARRSLRTW